MDESVRHLLRLLESDSRTSIEQLAAMVGLDPDEARRQIEQAETAGVIRRYKAVVNWERAGEQAVVAFINVRVSPERNVGFDDVAARIYRYPEVQDVYLMSGGYDLQVVIKGPTLQAVAMFVAEKLATIERVHATDTHFLLRRYKVDGEILVEQDEDRRLAVTP